MYALRPTLSPPSTSGASDDPRATSPSTLCEAFQTTAAAYPDKVALRTPDDSVSYTWRQYAQRVERLAAGLAGLGVNRGDTVGLMLTNRPEFHLLDTAAIHLGAAPFSIYNSLTAEQISYVLGNAGNHVMIAEEQFVPVLRQAIGDTKVEHLVCIDGKPEGTISLDGLEPPPIRPSTSRPRGRPCNRPTC